MPTIISICSDLKTAIMAKWLPIVAISFLVAGVQGILTRSEKGEYGAYSKIFPLSINKSGGSSPLDAIRAQFGIDDKTDFDKIYNVKELVTSRTVSMNIARSKPSGSKYASMSAWLIDDYNNNRPFLKKKIIADPLDSNDIYYKGASILLGNTEVVNDTKTNFTTITTKSHQKALTQMMNEKILLELSNYYIKLVTEKPRTDLEKIKQMRDSLQVELNSVERAIAGFIDANQMSVKTSTQLPQYKLIRMQREIEQLYTTTATSYQNAKFKLLSESPIFQVLDQAGAPYTFDKPNWKKNAAIAFMISCLVLCLFFTRKIIMRIVIDELSNS